MPIIESGTLYVVATPIGNLSDVSLRALEVLSKVSCIAAEDTRHTRKLLNYHGVSNHLTALHEHNEDRASDALLDKCIKGDDIALVSDAGTPIVSDPGQHLVSRAHDKGIPVVPIPGCSAALAALSVCGMQAERFVFEGFLPARSARRIKRLQALSSETRLMIFYEAVHRVPDFLRELHTHFGGNRKACVARELTKQFETIRRLPLSDLTSYYDEHPDELRGEFVVLVEGAVADDSGTAVSADHVLHCLLQEVSPSKAASIAAKITGMRKSELYKKALTKSNEAS